MYVPKRVAGPVLEKEVSIFVHDQNITCLKN